ncbi:alpha-amylase family protein [Gracilibacillus alcaliphilus]|uniref:alpha-amylase family protein n=1 Tax=Gracilibacillus alcaliphilus TaxID=1401441 RepID=UPI00195AD068|nr:alpha-amylase family protein [Gracilibacillus alcaliphilus]MBM7676752.1 hypothetical protein [Gracilibacillus alcaliphilus]
MEKQLRYRQVHMDFHTSPSIPDVGAAFDADQFAETLVKGHVDSVTLFARCHHGMIYYDSKKNPELVHPNLVNKSLLKDQIQACRERNIRTPIYTTVQWDHHLARKRPEWLTRDPEGAPVYGHIEGKDKLYQPGFYRFLCVNTAYRDFLKEHTLELLEEFSVDGLFFDIVKPIDCSCETCQKKMKSKGLNPANQEDRLVFAKDTVVEFKRDMSNFVRQYNQNCTIFYNRGHVGPAHREVAEAYSHFELESLPGIEWSYLHFPISVRYARQLGKETLGMTGKFHTSWGDFHSFRNQAALEYECFRMLALNSKASIGDQLEPSGRISEHSYELIGSVYKEIEKKEPWCDYAVAITEIGVLTTEEFAATASQDLAIEMLGVTSMLQEAGFQFDIIDSKCDFEAFQLLILPDNIIVGEGLARKIDDFVKKGGALIASYHSGLNPETTAFAIQSLGIDYLDEATYSPDFLNPQGEMGKGLATTEYVMYTRGTEVKPREAKTLVEVTVPYFNRTWEHFISHRHTPSSGKTGYPGILQHGKTIYFAHPIFKQYGLNAPLWCKQLLENAINLLLPDRIIQHNGPSTVEITINEQKQENRWVVHALHYIPQRKSVNMDTIEAVIPLYDTEMVLRIDNRTVKEISLVPEEKPVPFEIDNGYVTFNVPMIKGHQMISVTFE